VQEKCGKTAADKPAAKMAAEENGESAAKRRPLYSLIGAKTFSFSFLLILDEGGLREGWVKSAFSSLATTAWPRNHNSIFFIFLRQNGGRFAVKKNGGKSGANQRPNGGPSTQKRPVFFKPRSCVF
jgi:hypothetical protein